MLTPGPSSVSVRLSVRTIRFLRGTICLSCIPSRARACAIDILNSRASTQSGRIRAIQRVIASVGIEVEVILSLDGTSLTKAADARADGARNQLTILGGLSTTVAPRLGAPYFFRSSAPIPS